MLIKGAAQSDHTKNFVLLEGEAHENLPRHINGVAGDPVFKIHARVQLDARAGMIVDNIFEGEMSIGRLQMIRQAVFGAPEIEALVLDTGPEIPFAGNEKAMGVGEIVVERLDITEFRFVKIAIEGVGRFE